MTQKELDLHKIQMLQLTLQRIQGLEEKQALGVILTPQDLNKMGQRPVLSDQLACLKFNMSLSELNELKRMDQTNASEAIYKDSYDDIEDVADAVADALVLNYDDGASSDEDE